MVNLARWAASSPGNVGGQPGTVFVTRFINSLRTIRRAPPGRALVLLLLLAALLRGTACWRFSPELNDDPDAYLGIARSLLDGRGYASPGSTVPTAYRPPLYPVLLAGVLALGDSPASIGLLHVALGTATVWLTYVIGRRMGGAVLALAAAALVAGDPLLVRYSSQVMTESLSAFLAALLLAAGVPGGEPSRPVQLVRSAVVGVVFGLCTLCRPTFWAYGALTATAWGWLGGWKTRQQARAGVLCLAGIAVALAPWAVRNQLVFGKPLLTTTHGGYTLLLGNNPVYYAEEVARPWGAVWQADSLKRWQQQLEQELARARPPISGEVARDRWMTRRAIQHIAEQPAMFARACTLRVARLWNIAPLGAARAGIPTALLWAVGVFYTVVYLAALTALARIGRAREWRRWSPLLLLLLAFTGVHVVYFANVRMRAPLVPAISILAAAGALGLRPGDARTGHADAR